MRDGELLSLDSVSELVALQQLCSQLGPMVAHRLASSEFENLYNIDRWWSADLGDEFTFATSFVPISVLEAVAIVKYYNYHSKFIRDERLSHQESQRLVALQARIQDAITPLLQRDHSTAHDSSDEPGVMIRMSCRSPKDVAWKTSLMDRLLRRELARMRERSLMQVFDHRAGDGGAGSDEAASAADLVRMDPSTALQNDEFIAFFRAQLLALKVADARSVMRMLTSSERVHCDLSQALECEWLRRRPEQYLDGVRKLAAERATNNDNDTEPPPDVAAIEASITAIKPWRQFLAVRRWHDGLHVANEFRCFVYGRSLTAAAQYYYTLYFPFLHLNRDTVLRKLREFVERYGERIPFEHCVIDLALVPNAGAPSVDSLQSHAEYAEWYREARVICIEINPWGRFSDAGLFDWTEDHELLHRTATDDLAAVVPELRLAKAPLPYCPMGSEVSDNLASQAAASISTGTNAALSCLDQAQQRSLWMELASNTTASFDDDADDDRAIDEQLARTLADRQGPSEAQRINTTHRFILQDRNLLKMMDYSLKRSLLRKQL